MSLDTFKSELSSLVDKYSDIYQPKKLENGKDYLPPSGKVVGPNELSFLLDAASDMWLTAGRFSDEFEAKFPKFWGMRRSLLVNSGSSANLVAFSALTSPRFGERAIKPGDEFITAACGFPTTIAPAIQYGMKPVFVDVDIETHNVNINDIIDAITDKTKLIMIAHALGNPFRVDKLQEICKEKGIWIIEDCCDALGARIGDKHVGSFGDLATCSFYPAHHMTMGEGGAVLTNKVQLYNAAMSFRDWGRDCWCPPGKSNTCDKRFEWQLGDLPEGYDHKYIYAHIGYNLKVTDMQAAIGVAQMQSLESLIKKRQENHDYLGSQVSDLSDTFYLPKATEGTTPSWFGFFICLKEDQPQRRKEITQYLEAQKIGTRLLFGGNMIKQPAFQQVSYRIHNQLTHTDQIMNNGFWVGIWPGLENENLDYIAEHLKKATQL